MIYIATFYSHFEAIRYKKLCDNQKIECRMMPVPRELSSSCGTCVRYEGDELILPEKESIEGIEQIAEVTDQGYRVVYQSKNS